MNLDRHERRQQRVRGAGPSAVQASFGFNFGALGAGPAKQASLPPQRSSRRTPTIHTPRGANGSAKRHRSASIQRSSGAKRRSTPSDRTRTPQLGKRKRSSEQAQAGAEEEIDELSPDRDENVASIEKSRKHARTVSPVHEKDHGEPDELSILQEEPDELSVLEDGAKSVRRSFAHLPAATSGTRVLSVVKQRPYPPSRVQESPIVHRSEASPTISQRSLPRRSKSTETVPVTPGMFPNRRPSRVSATGSDADPTTFATAPADQDSEDELSPSHHQSTLQDERSLQPSPHGTEEEADELTLPIQASSVQTASVATIKKRGRPKKATEAQGEELQATPVARLNGKRKSTSTLTEFEKEELDELSPESDKARQRQNAPLVAVEEAPELSDAVDPDAYGEPEPQDLPAPTPPARKRRSPKQALRVKASSELPSRKRQKFLGPKHAISVMRIKGSTVRGITVADTARTILEESITHRLARMAEKLQTSKDSAQRKELRSWINLTLSFKESLDEKLLDLQDANDVLSTGFKKMKIFKRDNAGLRKEILELQNSRQEVAIEHDAIQAEFDADKERVETRNTLSANMYAIEAAVRNGREKALAEGREDEGPEIPLSMMIDNVSRHVGSLGGGLLDHVKGFNGFLERAAGWLESRA
ncbi:hypothetical protein IAQ61_009561 [Plenodomus lingam]|uniref:Inner kinetochore subunit AME1 domain-containing protein n=1 Tax=Leptosphaeria maculans (strain JN3 / isolate v23.1.3 / race Av1-4-5-6-7-8) TaxID=985895 RepID=E4ZT14_LEPMJ|nr:hypothetical protein LEMA_P120930.1 [Plenodomus lingam JN3]KAH9863284.1 hypothetical protein IAQ61_009561 [Plenodomus lingam]CBX94602.1 hypothetical protein LEMA_P120930.1 [Plenodomus lingam JN3]